MVHRIGHPRATGGPSRVDVCAFQRPPRRSRIPAPLSLSQPYSSSSPLSHAYEILQAPHAGRGACERSIATEYRGMTRERSTILDHTKRAFGAETQSFCCVKRRAPARARRITPKACIGILFQVMTKLCSSLAGTLLFLL